MTKPLSPRETQVARLYLKGKTPAEIATALRLELNTVYGLWHSTKKKTDTTNVITFAQCPTGKALSKPVKVTPTP